MLKNIQTLRFLAALLVVLHHLQPPITPFKFDIFPDFLTQFGFAGVDIFFVISGLIMAQTSRSMPPGLRASSQFLILRFGRIYIGWWPFFLLFFLSIAIRPEIDLWGSFFLWPQNMTLNLLPITWTLSFELYFYVGVAILVAWNRFQASFALIFLAIGIAALNIYFLKNGLYLPDNEARAKASLLVPFYLSPLTLEFIAGFLISDWLDKKPEQCLACWLTGAVVLFTLSYSYQTYLPQTFSGMAGFFHVCERTVLLGGFALCMVVCAMELERRKITPFSYLQKLGDASYSIYLSHLVFLIIVGKLFHKHQSKLEWSQTTWSLIAIVSILAGSRLYFRFYEKPMNALLKKLTQRLLTPSRRLLK